jgi:hypothetical protein
VPQKIKIKIKIITMVLWHYLGILYGKMLKISNKNKNPKEEKV